MRSVILGTQDGKDLESVGGCKGSGRNEETQNWWVTNTQRSRDLKSHVSLKTEVAETSDIRLRGEISGKKQGVPAKGQRDRKVGGGQLILQINPNNMESFKAMYLNFMDLNFLTMLTFSFSVVKYQRNS